MLVKLFITLFLWITIGEVQRNIHQRWQSQLHQYVAPNGKINYSDWQKEAYTLKAYLQALKDYPPQNYWTTADHKAYWINVYNAAAIHLVLEHYPLKSLCDIENPWKKIVFEIEKQDLSLEAIENKLREMEDPRIFFALHRASVSSPILSSKVYRSRSLEEQLEQASKKFLSDTTKNKYQKNECRISKILLWNLEDFKPLEVQLKLIRKYTCIEVDQKTKFLYLPFDWRLNE